MIYGHIITGQITMDALQSGSLKRKYEEDAVYSSSSPSSHSEWDSDEESPQSDTVDFGPIVPFSSSQHLPILPILKKTTDAQFKGSVQFGLVTVFLFQRCQGFSSVPSHGGCTLGMVRRHTACHQFTLAEHEEEQQRLRTERIREQHQEKQLEAMRQKLISSGNLTVAEAASLTVSDVMDEDVDLTITKPKGCGPLRPYSSKRRRALLRSAGIVRIDREEKRQLQELRQWRKDCGCHCKGFCEPETCTCSQAGVKCQMDRGNFPCGCSKEGCGNPMDRVEFNSSRVRSHYIHTHMKLELEKRLLDEKRIIVTEPPSRERNTPLTFPMENNLSSFTSLSPGPGFLLSSDKDNSSSSDMMDTSGSFSVRLDSEATGHPPSERLTLDVDDKGLAHILSFDDSDEDGCPNIKEYERVDMDQPLSHDLSTEAKYNMEDDTSTSQQENVDKNANQAILECVNDSFDIPKTPSPSYDGDCFMDLSLSSDPDLVFFDSLHECGPSLSYNHLRINTHLDYISHLQFPGCPRSPQIEDSGVCLLESLVGIS